MQESKFETPFVDIGGTRFLSDRFYLNRTVFDAASSTPFTSDFCAAYNGHCTCGSRKPPPLFDRELLVDSLDLKAAILGTYNVDIAWMAKAFPKLCGPNATVPTLCLHGQRRLSKKVEKCLQPQEREDFSSDEEDIDVSMVPEEGWRKTQRAPMREENLVDNLGENFFLSQVDTYWLPSKHRPSKSSDGSWRQRHPSVTDKRVRKRGVFHPKYMVLFEKTGSIIVVVSTSNLTKPSATDASWMQRFYPASSPKTMAKSFRRRNGSDFGAVLSDSLQQQSYAICTRGGSLLPEEFLKKFLNFSSLDDFEAKYEWSTSQVHLIATCPGEYEGRFTAKHLRAVGTQREFLYGRQRVADIISRLASETEEECPIFSSKKKWFPDSLMSEHDRLIFQPTSFGAKFSLKDMSNIVGSYLGYDGRRKKTRRVGTVSIRGKQKERTWQDKDHSDQELLEKMDIVWPSQRLMETISACRKRKRAYSPCSVAGIELPALGNQPDGTRDIALALGSGTLFMSSEAFNSTELSCLSQMALYEPSVPEQREPLQPHIKSVARYCYGENIEKLRKEYDLSRAEGHFPYFLLTSACLSHGAQGQLLGEPGRDKSTLSYSNFELGVLFCSRLTGDKDTDRLFCWRPQCLCMPEGQEQKRNPLIHLPIPYDVNARKYQLDQDEAAFAETPFLHEIKEVSGHIRSISHA